MKVIVTILLAFFGVCHFCFDTPLKECFIKFVEMIAIGIAFTFFTEAVQEGRKDAAREALEEFEREKHNR